MPVEIRNTGLRKATFSWGLSGMEWASLDETTAELNPGEKHHANIHLFPSANVSKGAHALSLTISSAHSSTAKSLKVDYQPESPAAKAIKNWFYYFRYYLYALVALLIVLFLLRNRIISSWQRARKERAIRKARLEALAKARKARMRMAKKRHKAEKKIRHVEEKGHWLTGFRIFSLVLVALAVLLGAAFAFSPIATAQLLRKYGTIASVVLVLGALIVYLLMPRKRRRKGKWDIS